MTTNNSNSEVGAGNRKLRDAMFVKMVNPLVATVCISYKNAGIGELPNTQKDKTKLKKLFDGLYKYDVLESPEENISEAGVWRFLDKVRDALLCKKKSGNQLYDGLIFVYSGHGDTDRKTHLGPAMLTSDDVLIPFENVRAYFGGAQLPQFAHYPKIIISDACRGGRVAEPVKAGTDDDAKKDLEPATTISEQFKPAKASGRVHPDINSVMIFGNTIGNVTFDVKDVGGRLIDAVDKLFRRNFPQEALDLDSLTKLMCMEVGAESEQRMLVEQMSTMQYNVFFEKRQHKPAKGIGAGAEFKKGTGFNYFISSAKNKLNIKVLKADNPAKSTIALVNKGQVDTGDLAAQFLLDHPQRLKGKYNYNDIYRIQSCGNQLTALFLLLVPKSESYYGQFEFGLYQEPPPTSREFYGFSLFAECTIKNTGDGDENMFYIQNCRFGKYIGCDDNGELVARSEPTDDTKWVFTPAWQK